MSRPSAMGPALLGALLLFGILARGLWDLWAQCAFLCALFLGAGLALLLNSSNDTPIRLPDRVSAWGVLFACLGISVIAAPCFFLARNHFLTWLSCFLFVTLLASLSARSRESLRTALDGSFLLIAIMTLTQLAAHPLRVPAGPFPNANIAAGALLLGIGWETHRFNTSNSRQEHLLHGVLIGLCLAALLATRSLGAWISFAAAWMFLSKNRRLRWTLAGLIAGSLLWKMLLPATPDRLHWWTAAWSMFISHPIFGVGPGAYETALPRYFAGALRSAYAHSLPLQVLAEWGIPAALALGRLLLSSLRRQPAAIQAGLAALLLQNLFDYSIFIPMIPILFFTVAALSVEKQNISQSPGVPLPRMLRYPAALACLIASLQSLNPWIAERYLLLAKAGWIETHHPETARFYLGQSLDYDPSRAETYALMSRVTLESKAPPSRPEIDEAILWQKRALQQSPDHLQYQRNLAFLVKLRGPSS